MNTNDCRKLIDLFLDDELPLELNLEFKEMMFSDSALSAEVAESRRTREAVAAGYANDGMREDERQRVFARIAAEVSAADINRAFQLDLPLSGQFQLPISQ
ncbi:MAG: anti-sigma factor family protein [Fimbriimonadales bacterium]